MSIRRGSSPQGRSDARRRGGGAWRGALILAGALALTACAHGARRGAAAAPAAPAAPAEVVFGRTSPEAVSAMIADKCRAMGWAVDRAGAESVTCTVSVPARQRILGRLMMQNPRGQTQSVSHHFLLSGAGDEVRVRSESWLSDPDRGRRRALSAAKADKVGREMTGFLVLMGGQVSRPGEAGATTP